MKNEMIRCFKMVYGEEEIVDTIFNEEDETLEIIVNDGSYLVEYNNGNIAISFIG